MEEIAQALIPPVKEFTQGEISEKLLAINNLASEFRGIPDEHHPEGIIEVSCLVCAPGIVRNLIDTAQLMHAGNLFDNVQIQRKCIFLEVLRKYILFTHRSEIDKKNNYHDTNLINAFINAFSKEWDFPSINDIFISDSIVTEKHKEAISQELLLTVTQDSITDRLATEYLRKIKENITINSDKKIDYQSAADALAKFAKQYGEHSAYSVFTTNDDSELISITNDPTAIKVKIACEFSQEYKARTPETNIFPLQWEKEQKVRDEINREELWRLGDLFWNKSTDGNDKITLPPIQALGEQYINEVGHSQLQQIIEQCSSVEDIPILNKIAPERLQAADQQQYSRFFAKLDLDNAKATRAQAYFKQHSVWFKRKMWQAKRHFLLPTLLEQFTPEELTQIKPGDIALEYLSAKQAEDFFRALAPNEQSFQQALDYAIKNKEWLMTLMHQNKKNPLFTLLITQSPPPEYILDIRPELALNYLTLDQIQSFLSWLDKNIDGKLNPLSYIYKYQLWFKGVIGIAKKNFLLPILLKKLTPEELAKRVPENDIALYRLSAQQADDFFKALALNGQSSEALFEYARQHRKWFDPLLKNNRENPLFTRLMDQYSADTFAQIDPTHIAMQGLSVTQSKDFFDKLADDRQNIKAAFDYAMLNRQWFDSLLKNNGENPLFTQLMDQYSADTFAQIDSRHIAMQGLSVTQSKDFFDKLAGDRQNIKAAFDYAIQNREWFDSLLVNHRENSLFTRLMDQYSTDTFAQINSRHIAMQGLSVTQSKDFFDKLTGDRQNIKAAFDYAMLNREWFDPLLKNNGENPLFTRLMDQTSAGTFAQIDSRHIAMQGLSVTQSKDFFDKLAGDRQNIKAAFGYAIQNREWFYSLLVNNRENPLFTRLMDQTSTDTFAQIDSLHIAMQGLSVTQSKDFFDKLAGDRQNIKAAFGYAMQNREWFDSLLKNNRENPLFTQLMDQTSADTFAQIDSSHIAMQGLSDRQLYDFFSQLEPDTLSIQKALNYATINKEWFEISVKNIQDNILAYLFFERLSAEQMMNISPDIVLYRLSINVIQLLLNRLETEDGKMTRVVEYINKFPLFFKRLIKQENKNTLLQVLKERLRPEELAKIAPNVILYHLSKLEIEEFFIWLDQDNSEMTRSIQYLTQFHTWFKGVVEHNQQNFLFPLIIKSLTSEELAKIEPDIVLYRLSPKEAELFLASLDQSDSVTRAIEYASHHQSWFTSLVAANKSNPLTEILLAHLSSKELAQQVPQLTLIGLSKPQCLKFFSYMTPEDARDYINHHSEWFNQQKWDITELLMSINTLSVQIEPASFDLRPVNTWQIPKVPSYAGGGTTRFSGQIIVQLENDPVVRKAAANLAAKHPANSIIVQLDNDGKENVVYGDPKKLTGNLRWQLVGHGREGKFLGQRTPKALAKQLKVLSTKLSIQTVPEHISLVGCSLAKDNNQSSYLRQFANSLTQEEFTPSSVSAYNTRLEVNGEGQKRLIETGNKITLTWQKGQWNQTQAQGKVERDQHGYDLLKSIDNTLDFIDTFENIYRENKLSPKEWIPMFHAPTEEETHSGRYTLTLVKNTTNTEIPPETQTVDVEKARIVPFLQQYKEETSRANKPFSIIDGEVDAEGIHGLNTAFALQTWFNRRVRKGQADNSLAVNLHTALKAHAYANYAQIAFSEAEDVVKFIQLVRMLSSGETLALKTFSTLSSTVGSGFNLLSVGLDSYELAHAQNEAQRTIFGTQLAFDLASLAVMTASLGAGMMGAATLSAFLGPLAIPLAGLGIGITDLVMITQEHIAKTKNVASIFATIDEGYNKGGYQLTQFTAKDGTQHQVWKSRPLMAFKTLDLRRQLLTYADTFIYKTHINGSGSGYANNITMALPQSVKRTEGKSGVINLREGIDHPFNTASFVVDIENKNEIPIELPKNPQYYVNYGYGSFPGVTLRDDAGLEVPRRIEKNHHSHNDQFAFDFYCFPVEYAICDLTFEFIDTPVEVRLDDANRTLIMPHQTHESKGKMAYTLNGGNGTYNVHLQTGASLTLDGGSMSTRWVLNANLLDSRDIPRFNSSGQLEIGGMKITLADNFQGTLKLINSEGTFLANRQDPHQPVMTQLNIDAERFTKWQPLHDHLKQISHTEFHQPFIIVDDYITPDGQRVSRAFYETAQDRFIFTHQPNAAQFLAGAQLAKTEGDTAWFYRNTSVWQVNIANGQVLREYAPIVKFAHSGITPSKSELITDNQGNLYFIVEFPTSTKPMSYKYQLTEQAISLVSMAGEEQDLPELNRSPSPFSNTLTQFDEVPTVRGTKGDVIHRLAHMDGNNYHSWLKISADKLKHEPFLQMSLATITPEDIQPIPVNIGDQTRYYFYSHQQQTLYFQPDNGLSPTANFTREVKTGIQNLFVMHGQLMAQHQDGTLWLADPQGNLLLAGLMASWLQTHSDNLMAQLKTLATKSQTLPALRLQGLADSQGKPIMAWYDVAASQVIQANEGIDVNHNVHYRGLSADGKQAWLHDADKGFLYRQPIEPNHPMMLNEKGQSIITLQPDELWSSAPYLSVESVDDKLRLITQEGAVLLLPKSATERQQAQLISWQVKEQTETQLTTAIEALRSQVTFAPTIRLIKKQAEESPSWYLSAQKKLFHAHGLDGRHRLHWLGLNTEQTKAYIHDRTTGDLWLADDAGSTAIGRYHFIFQLTGERLGELGELILQHDPSDKMSIPTLPLLKEVDRIALSGKREDARYLLDKSVLAHYRQITFDERGEQPVINLPKEVEDLSIYSDGQDLVLHDPASETHIRIINAQEAALRGMCIKIGTISNNIDHIVKMMHQLAVPIPGNNQSEESVAKVVLCIRQSKVNFERETPAQPAIDKPSVHNAKAKAKEQNHADRLAGAISTINSMGYAQDHSNIDKLMRLNQSLISPLDYPN